MARYFDISRRQLQKQININNCTLYSSLVTTDQRQTQSSTRLRNWTAVYLHVPTLVSYQSCSNSHCTSLQSLATISSYLLLRSDSVWRTVAHQKDLSILENYTSHRGHTFNFRLSPLTACLSRWGTPEIKNPQLDLTMVYIIRSMGTGSGNYNGHCVPQH